MPLKQSWIVNASQNLEGCRRPKGWPSLKIDYGLILTTVDEAVLGPAVVSLGPNLNVSQCSRGNLSVVTYHKVLFGFV